jgi:predicted AlkP superfamily phosphohydrolase/phosphomutase
MARVAAIGLDAGEWQLIEPMLADGQLPNLARIRSKSAECRLTNPLYRSTLVWEAFLTGRQDLDDDRSGGVEFDPLTYGVRKIAAGSTAPFYAGLAGVEAIAFDVPHLSLAGAANDVRVCTWGTHSRSHPRASNPPGLLREIDRAFGLHPAFRDEHRYAWHRPEFVEWLVRSLVAGSAARADIAAWLMDRFPSWQLFLTVMSESHSAGENLGHALAEGHPMARLPMARCHRTALLEVYRAMDAAIGRFAARLPGDAALVVFSILGTAANDSELSSTALLPELLQRLHFKRPFLHDPDRAAWQRDGDAIVPAVDESWDDYMRRHAGIPTVGLRQRARWLIPDRLVCVARSLSRGLSDSDSGASLDWQVPTWYRARWPRMKVFALPTFGDARLRLNVRGRERDGIVEPADYEVVCREAEEAIRACRDPRTGRSVVAETWRPRAAAPMAPRGCDADIVVQWSHAFDALEHPEAGLIGPFPFRRTGGHTAGGFAFFAGAGIAPRDLGEWRAIDLPATLVALLGRPLPPHLDGRPIPVLCDAAT